MKDIVLLYDNCCIYEIVILNYFQKCTGGDIFFCSVDGNAIRAMEGYSINTDMPLNEVDLTQVRSLIVPGGEIAQIDRPVVMDTLRILNDRGVLIAGICAGVDLLERAGILDGRKTVHSEDADCIRDGNILTARANAYVDFAIEAGKALDLFEDERDLQETVDFWKLFKRAEA